MYIQALLSEMGEGDLSEWTKRIAALDDSGLRDAVLNLFNQLFRKVQRGEKWTNLPADAVGGSEREIAQEVPKVVAMGLKKAIDEAWRDTTGRLVPVGYCQTFSSFKDAELLLKQKGASQAVASGNEARQRRDQELLDHEQLALFESILSCSVAEHQRLGGERERHPTDTLTLGVIVSLQFALGKRCMNVGWPSSNVPLSHIAPPTRPVFWFAPQLDDLKWGYLEVTRFTSHQVWDGIFPPYLALRSSSKGDIVGARKHLAGILNHRDPMRGAIPMLGLYFAYQFFTLQEDLPSLENWLDTMHKRPLIRLQNGRAAHTTDFNDRLKQDLELIGAKYSNFTLHGIRNQRIGEAHEDPNMRGDAILNGVGHSTGDTSPRRRPGPVSHVYSNAFAVSQGVIMTTTRGAWKPPSCSTALGITVRIPRCSQLPTWPSWSTCTIDPTRRSPSSTLSTARIGGRNSFIWRRWRQTIRQRRANDSESF